MNLSDPEILELSELCSALVDGTLTSAQRDRLNQWLAVSAEARRFYVYSMTLSASLHDYASEMQTEAPAAPARIVSGPARWWGLGSLAAAAALVFALWMHFSPPRPDAERALAADDDEEEEIVATLSGVTSGVWHGEALAAGAELRRGQRLRLTAGRAEIAFACGAEVELEGPATLELNSAWDAVLHRGALTASVPAEAIGFRVSNADVEVTDLGTHFSMVAGESGGTEVIVLAGAVQVAGGAGKTPVTLGERQARRFDRAKMSDVPDREAKLRRLAERAKFKHLARPASYLHWAFDELDGNTARAATFGPATSAGDLQLSPAPNTPLQRIDGRRQRALAFDGRTSFTATLPPISGTEGCAVAFWVRVPEDAPLLESTAMVAWRRGPAALAQVSWNRDPGQGSFGALRTETEQGYLVGTTPLRDGRWHHIAVVFGPNGRPRQYVDGRLEAVTAKRFKRPRPDRPQPQLTSAGFGTDALWLGRSALLHERTAYFRGAIDELFIADRALTPPEIRHLRREHRPQAPSTLAATP